ncbi:MAG: GGDEF domain-containing protein [Myxococcales bacterium]|jgi:diguanylate cyclase (GGDEF)-like protein
MPARSEQDDTTRLRKPTPDAGSVRPGARTEGVLTVLRGPNAGALFTLDGPRTILGRSGEAQVLLTDRALSRRHACIARRGGEYFVQDLGSTNGTFVDGEPATEPIALHDGSRIELGAQTILRFGLHDSLELQAARRTHELMIRDALTQVFNRRHLEDRLRSEVAFAQRHDSPLTVLLIDIDRFKQVNDRGGHEAGDAVLRILARALERMLRTEDVLGRWGGEEFVVLARAIERDGAARLAERIRRGVEVLRIPVGRASISVTASIGVAHAGGQADASELLRAADEAMYAAKAGGRNRVELAPLSGRGEAVVTQTRTLDAHSTEPDRDRAWSGDE